MIIMLTRSRLLQRFPQLRWLAPNLFVLIALALQWMLHDYLGGLVFLFLYPAIAIGALLGSRVANIVSVIIGLVGAFAYAYARMPDHPSLMAFAIFIIAALTIAVLSESILRTDLEEEQEAHKQTERLLNTLPIFAGVQSIEGKVVLVNQLALKAIEAEAHDVLGKHVWDCPWFDGIEGIKDRLQEALVEARQGLAQQFETPYVYREQGKRQVGWVSFSMIPVANDQGLVQSITTTAFDISEWKLAEEKLKQVHQEVMLEKQKFASVFAKSTAIMALTRGSNLIFEKTNEAFQELIDHRDVVGLPLVDAVPEVIGTPFPAAAQRVYASGEPFHFKEALMPMKRAGGTIDELYLDFTAQRIDSDDGSPYGVLFTAVDVTAQVNARQALRNQFDWLGQLLNRVEAGVILMDPRTQQIIFCNEAAQRMTGGSGVKQDTASYPEEAQVLDAAGQVLPRDMWPQARAARGETIQGERFCWKTAEGTAHFLHYASLIPASYGREPTVLICVLDITELKAAEAQITRLKNSNIIGIISWSIEGGITDANDLFLEMVGYSRDELVQGHINWRAMTPPEWQELDEQGVQELREQRLHRPYEKEYVAKDGRRVPIIVGSAMLEGSDDTGISFILDISEQKRAQENLAASEERFRKIAESLPELVWTAKPDGQVDYYNSRINHYSGAKVLNDHWEWQPLVHPDDKEQTTSAWQTAVAEGQNYQCEHRLLMADGSYRWHLSRGTPLFDKGRRLVRWFGTATDIHDQITVQTELKKAKEAAESANRMKSAFLANMSHEIRTPLGAILGFTELLKDPGIDESEKSSFLDVITRNGEQLTSIIDDVLDLSKIEAGQLRLETLPTAPRELIDDVTALLQIKAREKNIALDVSFEGPIPHIVSTDTTRLKQILVNIVGNAIKFTPQGGQVSCLVRYERESRRGAWLVMDVQDTGVGMTPDQQAQIFRPFSQADESTTRKFGGTGLGLSLSKRLAEALGGSVELVRSIAGVGSCFRIRIEDKMASFDERPSVEIIREQHADDDADLEGIRVLLVEDSTDNQTLVVRVLSKKKAMVSVASNGHEGIEKARSGDFDVILMDVQMPVLDGHSATQLLREQGYEKPIIALTAHAMNDARTRSLGTGCTDFLSKPINIKQLIEKVAIHGRRQIKPESWLH